MLKQLEGNNDIKKNNNNKDNINEEDIDEVDDDEDIQEYLKSLENK